MTVKITNHAADKQVDLELKGYATPELGKGGINVEANRKMRLFYVTLSSSSLQRLHASSNA
jgi:hypothetical protein